MARPLGLTCPRPMLVVLAILLVMLADHGTSGRSKWREI